MWRTFFLHKSTDGDSYFPNDLRCGFGGSEIGVLEPSWCRNPCDCCCYFFPNDLRCGFRKLKEEGGGKSVFWSSSGAENFFVVVIVFVMHAGPTSKSAW